MSALFSTAATFMAWLTLHEQVAYWVLFVGSFFETLVFTSFFVPGELFLIAGAVLAGSHVLSILWVSIALYAGAIIGDNTSFFIGHHTGARVFKEGRRVLNPINYKKGSAFFERHGNKAIFLARLLGPLSWITPFLAGVYRVPYSTFVFYNTPGILFGVGEFLVVGYFFADQYHRVLLLVEHYFLGAVLLAAALFLLRRAWQRRETKRDEAMVDDIPEPD